MDYQVLFGVYVDYYAALLTIIIALILLVKRDHESLSGRILFFMLALNSIILIIEGSSYFVNNEPGTINYFLNHSLNYLLFLLSPLVASIWAIYIDFTIFHSMKRLKKRFYYLHPVLLGSILILINSFHPILYTITDRNVYERLPFTYLVMSTFYILFIYMVYLIIQNKKKLRTHVLYGLAAFLILPVIGGTIQMFNEGLSTLYSLLSLGIVFVYIINETIDTTRDFDTNLLTRKKAYDYIEYLIHRNKAHTIILFDLDDFKGINDELGHLAGDDALNIFSNVLKMIFKEGYAYRFGGDEFLIVSPYIDPKITSKNISLLEDELLVKSNDLPYTLQTSYGLATHVKTKNESVDDLLHRADEMLYLAKKDNKDLKRRESDT